MTRCENFRRGEIVEEERYVERGLLQDWPVGRQIVSLPFFRPTTKSGTSAIESTPSNGGKWIKELNNINNLRLYHPHGSIQSD
mmetsp:Transcript_16612/g.42836  ORF Transcript_16612/g.42836 Transcript_16612/m.42836 type:complete len:83 (-) Transcript_16612:110-358(-)